MSTGLYIVIYVLFFSNVVLIFVNLNLFEGNITTQRTHIMWHGKSMIITINTTGPSSLPWSPDCVACFSVSERQLGTGTAACSSTSLRLSPVP